MSKPKAKRQDLLDPIQGPVFTVRFLLALLLMVGGIAWIAYYYLAVRVDPAVVEDVEPLLVRDAYVVAAPSLLGVEICWRWLLESIDASYAEQALVTTARALQGSQLLLFTVLGVFVAPFFEELVFRAFLQPLLVQNLGDRWGVAEP